MSTVKSKRGQSPKCRGPKGYDFGSSVHCLLMASFDFVDALSKADIFACAYGLNCNNVLSIALPEVFLVGNRAIPGISFKPQNDGAAHWVLNLDLQTPFVCSITQLDDGVDTAMVAMILALFLKGFEHDIRDELTTAQGLACDELAIQICNTRDLPGGMDKYIKPAVEDQVCAVTRPTDPADTTTPTIIICRDDIASCWKAGHRKGGNMQLLVGLSLVEIAYRLFKGEVDLESLRPKIVGIVRKII